MSFRLRLIVAMVIAVFLPLIPLLINARSSITTGISSLAPETTGEALHEGLEMASHQLATVRESLEPTLDHLRITIPSDPEVRLDSPLLVPLSHELQLRQNGHWYTWAGQRWEQSTSPPQVQEAEFGQFPANLQVHHDVPSGPEWVLTYNTDDRFRETALLLKAASADWAVSRGQQDRLLRTLTITLILSYALAMIFAVIAGLLVLRPLIRRIQQLTDTAEQVRGGDEDVRAGVTGNDEVTRLARTFNLMLDGLADSRQHAAEMEKRAAWRELAPVLAHEIKNPLTPIQLSVQQLAESYSGDDERFSRTLRTAREIVDEEISRLRKLVREFSDFARAPKPELEDVDLARYVHDLGTLYGDHLELHSDTMPATARFDPEQLRRALVNLIDNAMAAAGEDGQVRLTVTPNALAPDSARLDSAAPQSTSSQDDRSETPVPTGLCFIVEDSGPGVPEDLRQKIFEPYMTTKSNGIGLGLPVVKTTVEEHGGDVSVEQSDALGGARFTLALPVNPTD